MRKWTGGLARAGVLGQRTKEIKYVNFVFTVFEFKACHFLGCFRDDAPTCWETLAARRVIHWLDHPSTKIKFVRTSDTNTFTFTFTYEGRVEIIYKSRTRLLPETRVRPSTARPTLLTSLPTPWPFR